LRFFDDEGKRWGRGGGGGDVEDDCGVCEVGGGGEVCDGFELTDVVGERFDFSE